MTEKEIIKRKILIKRQLIELTEQEIEQLENSLNEPSLALENATESVSAI